MGLDLHHQKASAEVTAILSGRPIQSEKHLHWSYPDYDTLFSSELLQPGLLELFTTPLKEFAHFFVFVFRFLLKI